MNNIKLADYNFIRIAVSSPECKVMDLEFNFNMIKSAIEFASENSAQIIAFPELALTSISGEDLFFQNNIYERINSYLVKISELSSLHKICILIGFPTIINSKIYNCNAIINEGKILAIIPKSNLSKSDKRYFSDTSKLANEYCTIGEYNIPILEECLFNIIDNNNQISVSFSVVSDDILSLAPYNSIETKINSHIIFNLSLSIEIIGSAEHRRKHITAISEQFNCAYIYACPSPGESSAESVFSGHSIIAENGKILNETQRLQFYSQTIISDIDLDILISEKIKNINNFDFEHKLFPTQSIDIQLNNSEVNKLNRNVDKTPFIPNEINKLPIYPNEIITTLATALIKRLNSINCENLVLGLSGGLDSTFALIVANEAYNLMQLDKKNIHCISMPGFGTTERTKSNAEKLAEAYGTSFREISIRKSIEQHFIDISHNINDTSVVYENAQARERTQILMDISNKVNGIVLGTGDLSESALGWCTYNGDHISMYNPNCGVPKTLMQYIISSLKETINNNEIKEILESILTTPISPELLPLGKDNQLQQKTEDKIGSYLINDFFIYNFIRYGYSPKKLYLLTNIAFKSDFSEIYIKEKLISFYKRFFNSQFKRSCVPDGPQITEISLSPRAGWKMVSDSSMKLWLDQASEL